MGEKRKASGDDKGGKRQKRHWNASVIVEPFWRGVYVTCVRGKEKIAQKQAVELFQTFAERFYGEALKAVEDDDDDDETKQEKEKNDNDDDAEKFVDADDEIAREMAEMQQQYRQSKQQQPKGSKTHTQRQVFTAVDLGTECVFFVRCRGAVDPEQFVVELCKAQRAGQLPYAKHVLRLSPVSLTQTANEAGLQRLKPVIAKHFHGSEQQQPPLKFAIRPTIRNHNILARNDVIQAVAEMVGRDHGHQVDLKNYDKLILVDCCKSSIGMGVVSEFESLARFNLETLRAEAAHPPPPPPSSSS